MLYPVGRKILGGGRICAESPFELCTCDVENCPEGWLPAPGHAYIPLSRGGNNAANRHREPALDSGRGELGLRSSRLFTAFFAPLANPFHSSIRVDVHVHPAARLYVDANRLIGRDPRGVSVDVHAFAGFHFHVDSVVGCGWRDHSCVCSAIRIHIGLASHH